MQKLRHLSAPRASSQITLRGQPFTVREVRDRDRALLERLIPSPTPPQRPNPAKGSLAPHEPDFNDAGYRASRADCLNQRHAATIAIALNAEDAQDRLWDNLTKDDERLVWIKDAGDTVGNLTVGEVDRIDRILDGFTESTKLLPNV